MSDFINLRIETTSPMEDRANLLLLFASHARQLSFSREVGEADFDALYMQARLMEALAHEMERLDFPKKD